MYYGDATIFIHESLSLSTRGICETIARVEKSYQHTERESGWCLRNDSFARDIATTPGWLN